MANRVAVMSIEAAIEMALENFRKYEAEDTGRGINARITIAMLPPFIRAYHAEHMRLIRKHGSKSGDGDKVVVSMRADDTADFFKGFEVAFASLLSTLAANIFPCDEGGENGVCGGCLKNREQLIAGFCENMHSFAQSGADGSNRGTFTLAGADDDARKGMN